MTTHKAYLSFIGHTQKTAKTECGKTVRTALIAVDADCTCIDCRAAVDANMAAMTELTQLARACGRDALKVEAALHAADPTRYHTHYFPLPLPRHASHKITENA